VEQEVRVPMSQAQFEALMSFVFNVGVGALGASTLLRKLNAGDRDGAADELLRWSRAGGRVLERLLRRRRAERALFLSSAASPHAVLTAHERRMIREYDGLAARGLNRACRRQLRQVITAQRQRIWRRPKRRVGDDSTDVRGTACCLRGPSDGQYSHRCGGQSRSNRQIRLHMVSLSKNVGLPQHGEGQRQTCWLPNGGAADRPWCRRLTPMGMLRA
jgi:hypothetical protein